MKRQFGFLAIAVAAIVTAIAVSGSHALTPIHLWSQRFGGTTSDFGYSVAADGAGNVFVTGSFTGTANFGGGNVTSAGGADMFLVKYNAAGEHQWTQRFGSTNDDVGYSIAVDGSGNVLATGSFAGTVNFGGNNLVSAGGPDIFVAKYNTAGVHQWSQRFGSASNDVGYSIAVDGSGNVFVTGSFAGTVNFGGSSLVSAGLGDIFLAKYGPAGAHLWSKRFGGAASDVGYAIAVDGSGDVIATGAFQSVVDFGGGNLVSGGYDDIFVAKYDAAGVHQWSKRFGSNSNGYDDGNAIAVDAAGNVFVTGFFTYAVDFGGGNLLSSGSYDIFLAKFSGTGAHLWSKRFGNANIDIGYSLATDQSGNVFATGQFWGTANFGGGNLVGPGTYDIFIAKYDAAGVHQWSRGFGSTGGDVGRAVVADEAGNMIATGYFNGTVGFGGANLASAGVEDLFMVKYASHFGEPIITSITDVGNDQGRQVKIEFERSGSDDPLLAVQVERYDFYRRDDTLLLPEPVDAPSGDMPTAGWLFAGSVPAHADDEYGAIMPTLADSTVANGQHYSTFFIRAALTLPAAHYDSPADSGYSIDNLAPGIPENLAYEAGVLSWNTSTAVDFDHFTVYGAVAASFGAATAIDYTVTPALDVSTSPYDYYFVTATDRAGNEGRWAVTNARASTRGVPESYILSIASFPNPFNPTTTIRYTVPARGYVSVAVYDGRGARVAVLVNEMKDAGAYTKQWGGRDDAGRPVASGIYFACVTQALQTRSYKMLLLK